MCFDGQIFWTAPLLLKLLLLLQLLLMQIERGKMEEVHACISRTFLELVSTYTNLTIHTAPANRSASFKTVISHTPYSN